MRLYVLGLWSAAAIFVSCCSPFFPPAVSVHRPDPLFQGRCGWVLHLPRRGTGSLSGGPSSCFALMSSFVAQPFDGGNVFGGQCAVMSQARMFSFVLMSLNSRVLCRGLACSHYPGPRDHAQGCCCQPRRQHERRLRQGCVWSAPKSLALIVFFVSRGRLRGRRGQPGLNVLAVWRVEADSSEASRHH